ncbi:MAG: hypothetical protein M3466_15295 [Gemmatimonadota bacterium]|nr:hypothetical protein [Gemmatimonadota bacterium]
MSSPAMQKYVQHDPGIGARECFEFYGCAVEVTSADHGLVEEVRRDFMYFTCDTARGVDRDATVRVEMRLEPPPYEALPAIPAAFLTPRNVCFRDGPIMYVDYFGRALAVVDRKRRSCLIYSTDTHLAHEAAFQFILSTVGQHLDRRGLHRIHALGVRHRGKAVLLLLPSGGGKSTMALELLRQPDFELIGEDTPLVDRRGRILPFPLRLGVRPGHDVEIPAPHLRTVRRMEFDPKTLIDIDYFKGRLTEPDEPVEPGLILIGERNLSQECDIVPLAKRTAMKAMVKYMVVGLGVYQGLEFMLERGLQDLSGTGGVVSSRFYSSCRLLTRAPAYRFVLGRDIAKNTRCLLDFIRQ